MPLTEYPVDYNGEMLPYIPRYGNHTMVLNKPFRAVMTVVDYTRGQSSFKIVFKDENDVRWEMFVAEFIDIVKTLPIIDGTLPSMEYHVVKRGQNYGLARV